MVFTSGDLGGVDDIKLAGGLGRHNRVFGVLHEGDAARPLVDLHMANHLESAEIDAEDIAAGFAGQPDALAVRRDPHTFRFAGGSAQCAATCRWRCRSGGRF